MPKFKLNILILSFVLLIVNGLEDDIKFDISWRGAVPNKDIFENINSNNILNIKTNYDEAYKCILPDIKSSDEGKKASNEIYMPVSSIIDALHVKKICSYRIESYWIYELCHGQYIRQYHETKQSGKRVVPEEYFLGYYDEKAQDKEYYEENGIKKTNVQWKMLDGKRVPTFAMKYNKGTNCAIIDNKARETTVFYACDENGNENIISFEEISSCTYEMVVTSRSICSHPAFQPLKDTRERIECYSMEKSAIKPFELTNIESENQESIDTNNQVTMTSPDGSIFVIRYKTGEEDANEFHDPNQQQQQQHQHNHVHNQAHVAGTGGVGANADKDVINSFISGTQCLNGGTGWWKYEVCFGKHVIQYHEEDINGPRTVIILGKWNKQRHLKWIEANPNKKPQKKTDKMSLSLFHSDGDLCERTNAPRHVEVKLKCDRTRKSHAIALYLLEPNTCEYVLAIESPLLCALIETADDNGLVNEDIAVKP